MNKVLVLAVAAATSSMTGLMSTSTGVMSTSSSSMTSSAMTTPVASTMQLACPVELSFMKLGNDSNNPADVTKLQFFLKNYEQADVDVNGKFDQKTDAAVRAFQKKYAYIILAPWDATRASGIVRITTAKAINQIVCKTPLSLSADDMAIISDYRKSVGSGPLDTSNASGDSMSAPTNGTSAGPTAPTTPQAPTTPDVSGSNSQTIDMSSTTNDSGSTTQSSGGGGFLHFLKSIF